jgi:hypothetical protein
LRDPSAKDWRHGIIGGYEASSRQLRTLDIRCTQ